MAHPYLSALVLTFCEMGAGILLVVGFYTRLASGLVAALSFNYWLATFHYGLIYCGFNLLLIVMSLCVAAGDAGRIYGIDSFFVDD